MSDEEIVGLCHKMHEDCVDFTLLSWSGVSGTGGCSRLADANVIRAIGSQNVKMADGRDQVRRVEQMLVTHDLGNGWPVQPDVVMVWSKSSGFLGQPIFPPNDCATGGPSDNSDTPKGDQNEWSWTSEITQVEKKRII